MTTPTDKGTGAFLCENRHAMVHYWASECPAWWNHARGRRELANLAADLVDKKGHFQDDGVCTCGAYELSEEIRALAEEGKK